MGSHLSPRGSGAARFRARLGSERSSRTGGPFNQLFCVFGLLQDLVVGRDNGDVEIYAFDPTLATPLKLLFKKAMNECVTSVEAGFITDTTLEDIVLATYSGKVRLGRGLHVNSTTHVPQKLPANLSCINPVSMLSVPVQTVP